MLIAKCILILCMFYSLVENIIKWKTPKKQEVYGGWSYIIGMGLVGVLWYYVGLFEPIVKIFK